jgi:hypothetical protein
MSAASVFNLVPASWHAATIPLPPGDDIVSFIDRFTSYVSVRLHQMWTWAPGRHSDEIVLAAPDPGQTAVLLAYVLVLGALDRDMAGIVSRKSATA